RIRLLAEADGKFVRLRRIEHAPGELGRFAERDGQDAAGQRVEGAAMADLGLGLAGLAQQALDRAYRCGRTKSERLVENDPAVEHLTIVCRTIPAGPPRYGRPAATPRGRRR